MSGRLLWVVLGAVLLAGYSLLRDVQRESDTALMRSNFVASVSHELKTPLTSIRAHAETLLMGRAGDADTTGDYLKTIVSESERLGRLVESVLEFSRIEQGRKTYRMQTTRLDDVVCAAARTLAYPLAQLGFTLTIESDSTAPTFNGDPEALTQAILNLLGNAMKYQEARSTSKCGSELAATKPSSTSSTTASASRRTTSCASSSGSIASSLLRRPALPELASGSHWRSTSWKRIEDASLL